MVERVLGLLHEKADALPDELDDAINEPRETWWAQAMLFARRHRQIHHDVSRGGQVTPPQPLTIFDHFGRGGFSFKQRIVGRRQDNLWIDGFGDADSDNTKPGRETLIAERGAVQLDDH